MTPNEVLGVVEPLFRPALGDKNVQVIEIREADDWTGEPSLYVDVFVVPGVLPVGAETYLRLRRSLSEELDAMGERRFAHLRLRDRAGEKELDDLALQP